MGEGLQRAARAAKLTNYPGTPAAAPRQVWADNDRRANGRVSSGFHGRVSGFAAVG